jgi:hypothetical protein
MRDFPVVVSFYTKDTPYEKEVQNLIQSCKKFNLETSIDGIDSFGSWELNCAFKPFFLFQKLQELKRKLLWVDADAMFVKEPTPLDVFAADLAVRINQDLPDDHPSKVMSGTVFVNFTPQSQELLRKWAQACIKELMDQNRREEFWEQTALRDIIVKNNHPFDIRSLPISYTKISGHPTDEKITPIIEHYQASRRHKSAINQKI